MKTLLVSDTHFANHQEFATTDERGLNSRFLLQLKAFDEALDWGIKQGCKRICHLGDVFHTRGYVEPELFNGLLQCLNSHFSTGEYKEMIILSGNHDIVTEGEVFNTAAMLRVHPQIWVVTEPETFGDDVFIPFTKNFTWSQSYLKSHVLFMHQSLKGVAYEDDETVDKYVDPVQLKQFKHVFCGHIHPPTTLGNITVVGMPYPKTFGDVGPRYVYCIENGKVLSKFSPKHPQFITTNDPKKLNDYDFFRYIGEKLVDKPNVRTQRKVEAKFVKRLKNVSVKSAIEQYVKDNNGDKQLVKTGVELWNRF